jgi:hypothetical protein
MRWCGKRRAAAAQPPTGIFMKQLPLVALLLVAALISACASKGTGTPGGIPPGMNANGEVIDSAKVEAGHGSKLKVGDVEGEITGKALPGGRFNQLKIGMTLRQVTDLIGQPSDRGLYATGKSAMPFYFGNDRHRYELIYKSNGRLVFAGPGGLGWSWDAGTLIWIIHNPAEPGYR